MTNRPRAGLSICLIVKDEAELLPGCLESLSDLDAQLIVVDTGSSDDTIKIAEQYGAEIHHFGWCNDFSKARNESIKYARRPWIFWLDADERLTQKGKSELLKLLVLEQKPVLYRVRIKNLKEDGVNYTLSDAHRLFTNFKGIHFTGSIHEQISPSASSVKAKERWSDIELDHLGYSFTDSRRESKQIRNRNLLLQQVKENPKNAYAHYTLGHNYKLDKELGKAREHYSISLSLDQFDDDMKASLLNSYADTLLDLDDRINVPELIQHSIKLKPLQNAAYYLQYRHANAVDDWEMALQSLDSIKAFRERIKKEGTSISTDIEIAENLIDHSRGELLLKLNRPVDAANAYALGLEHGGDTSAGLIAYFKVLEGLQDWPRAMDAIGRLMKLEGEQANYLQALATILLKQSNFEAALQVYLQIDRLHGASPKNNRKVAAMYAKLGNIAEAQVWLSKDLQQ